MLGIDDEKCIRKSAFPQIGILFSIYYVIARDFADRVVVRDLAEVLLCQLFPVREKCRDNSTERSRLQSQSLFDIRRRRHDENSKVCDWSFLPHFIACDWTTDAGESGHDGAYKDQR